MNYDQFLLGILNPSVDGFDLSSNGFDSRLDPAFGGGFDAGCKVDCKMGCNVDCETDCDWSSSSMFNRLRTDFGDSFRFVSIFFSVFFASTGEKQSGMNRSILLAFFDLDFVGCFGCVGCLLRRGFFIDGDWLFVFSFTRSDAVDPEIRVDRRFEVLS